MTFRDQLGRTVELRQWPPQRIISLVPSQTELICDLGLEKELVGITKFCVHPNHIFRTKTRIGGTKTVDVEKIHALQPDLIVANKEENVAAQVEALMADFPVWVSDVPDLNSALAMIDNMGALCGKKTEALRLCSAIAQDFETLAFSPNTKKRVAYLIWQKPWMAAGGDTFIHDMLCRCGWENVFAAKARYPEIDIVALVHADPDLVLLSSEPFPFQEKHIAELQVLLPRAEIWLADGELFSWYGSRLLKSAAHFRSLVE
jgi:ABC-type Fe3+-hydroxamate transport system substrate-binding protein